MALVRVVAVAPQDHRLEGDAPMVGAANRFLEHLAVRRFSPATVRAYAFDLTNFAVFLADRSLDLAEIAATDLFDYLDWQARRVSSGGKVVALRRQGSAPATMNRRIAAVRGLFEHLVTVGERADKGDRPVASVAEGLLLRRRRTGR
jgi:site-specific recombinase XerD